MTSCWTRRIALSPATDMRFAFVRAGKRRILTLKGPPLGDGALHRREEIEAELDADSPGSAKKGRVSRARWPEPIKSRVTEIMGEEHLLSLIHTDIHRTTWKIERAGRVVAELAYDVGEVSANGKSDAVNELEIELKGAGAEADLILGNEVARADAAGTGVAHQAFARGWTCSHVQRPDPGRRDLHALAEYVAARAA